MLSIIISSYQPEFYLALEKNIAETIGIPYEVIKVDNPGKMGICEAYNHGAQKAQYDYLLFMHEDVLFETQNWGKELIELLNLENCGVIGVAGTDYYGYVPYQWANRKSKIHIIQSNKQKNKKEKILRKNFKKNSTIEKVKALDGVFLACHKNTYLEFPFDSNLNGYHGYDLLFSLKISKNRQNYISDKITIIHYSEGTLSKEWLQSILLTRKIIGKHPNQKFEKEIEKENFGKLIMYLDKFKFTNFEKITVIFKYLNPFVLGFLNSIKILNKLRYILKKIT